MIPKELLRGDSIFAFLIFTVVAIFLANTAVSVWQNIAFEKGVRQKASVQNVRALGGVLAKATEALLAANEVSMLRRAIAEAGLEHDLVSCRIVLPDGGILAAADPRRITAVDLPESWARAPGQYTETYDGNRVMFSFPLDVAGRGSASLQITARPQHLVGARQLSAGRAGLEPPATSMAIACLALAAMLLIYRHARFRLKAIGAIHEALYEFEAQHPALTRGAASKCWDIDMSCLEVDPQLGQEAVAWNTLLGQRQGQQIRSAIQQVKESIQAKAQANGELAAACDALPQGLILVNKQMRIDYANGAAAVLLQTSRAELANGQVSQFITDERVIEAVHKAADGPTYERTLVEVRRPALTSGAASKCWVSAESMASGVLRFIVRPVRRGFDGELSRTEDVGCAEPLAMIIIEDVTQQRVAEAAMNSFLSKAAHELRTPLTNVQLYTDSALDSFESAGADPSEIGKCLNVINNESKRLARIVSDILSVSEIEAGSLTLARRDVRLDVLLEQLEADYGPQARDKQITLEFNLPPKFPVLQADRDKISLGLHNLLANALKYTPQNGQVTVSATVGQDQISIEITDTGIGISSEDAERIFDRFYRANDKRIEDVIGSGLGLTIAREVIRLHGGDISVESELDKGSTFTLTLPIIEEATLSGHPDRTTRSGDSS